MTARVMVMNMGLKAVIVDVLEADKTAPNDAPRVVSVDQVPAVSMREYTLWDTRQLQIREE